MSDKKLPKIKHNHTLTDILKASIFSLVMMAPVTAIGVTCAYVVCNKNAYQSYYGSRINETTLETINYDEMIPNNEYQIYKPQGTNTTGNITIDCSPSIEINNIIYTQYTQIQIFSNYVGLYGTGLSTQYFNINNMSVNAKFTYVSYTTRDNYNSDANFYEEISTPYSYLDNVFYYAVDTMQDNSLFSWTKTTAIYTPVNAMTTGMGINTPAIAVLLVYWLLCTAVYIIIDIVVKGFTWLTHLIGER